MSDLTSATKTTSSQLPSWYLPYAQYGLNQAYANYQGVTSPQQLVAPFSTQQNQAITGITNLATQGTPETTAAQNYVTSVLSGQPAQNPYLDSMFNQGANAVQNRLESEFANSGRNVVGSLPLQADEMNNLATQIYGGAYNTGVQQQENALAQAVPLEQQQFNAQQNLFNAGGAIQNQAQNYITAPQQFLGQYLQQIGLIPSGTTQTSTTIPSTLQQIGAYGQLGSQLGSGLGSLLNSLSSYFSS